MVERKIVGSKSRLVFVLIKWAILKRETPQVLILPTDGGSSLFNSAQNRKKTRPQSVASRRRDFNRPSAPAQPDSEPGARTIAPVSFLSRSGSRLAPESAPVLTRRCLLPREIRSVPAWLRPSHPFHVGDQRDRGMISAASELKGDSILLTIIQ